MPAQSQVSRVTRLSGRDRADRRRKKLRTNLVARVTARYHQGRAYLPKLTHEQAARLEAIVDDLIDAGTVTDGEVNRLAADLRRQAQALAPAPRSESAPLPDVPPPLQESELPPLGDRPSSRSGAVVCADRFDTSGGEDMCPSTVTSLVRPDGKIAKSAKPSVIRRRENLVCDEPWNRLIQEDMQKYAVEQKQHQMHVQSKIRDCRTALDLQVNEIQRLKNLEREEARRFATEEMDRRQRWLDDEKRRQAERHEAAVRERKVRDRQLETERQNRIEEQAREKEEEEEYRRKLQDEAKVEAEAEQKKKQHHMNEYRRFMEFNKAEQHRKKALIEQEKQQDKDMLAAHAALLERQELQRVQELKKFQDKQAAKVDSFLKIYKDEQARLLEDEAKREREMHKIAEKQRAEERLREERQRAGKAAFQRTLDEQLKAKQEEKRREQVEQKEFRELQEHEVRASVAYDAEQRQKRRQIAKRHLNELNSQVAEKHEKNMRDIQVGIARQDGEYPRSVRRSPAAGSAAAAVAAQR
eukprot:TRINITY_DN6303_c1_g1_i1.p1 TRINITY_DN6303_c1_g1~~TRINITY_DN6303_c1_g1_i1.p1  ORF type:complete len:560 (+),score=244.95 TRINITY_DN6303_c1_g1_i1:100-1680(+)